MNKSPIDVCWHIAHDFCVLPRKLENLNDPLKNISRKRYIFEVEWYVMECYGIGFVLVAQPEFSIRPNVVGRDSVRGTINEDPQAMHRGSNEVNHLLA